jgi:hypothetical protein
LRTLQGLLALPRIERGEAEVRWMRGLMESHGSIDHARDVAHGVAG